MTNALRKTAPGLLFLLSLVLTAALSLPAQPTAAGEPVNRRILAIYDSRFEQAADVTLVHSRAEMPLNHLGYIVDYRDAATNLPDPLTVKDYAAVITWFTYDVSRPSEYMAWARQVSANGVPFIIFGQIGVPATSRYLPSINKLLGPMGITYTSNFVEATNDTTVLVKDSSAIGYERPLDAMLPGYPVVRRAAEDAAVLLEVQASERERNIRSALVTAGPSGAFIPSGFVLYADASLGRTQWIVNPFVVFRKVLGTATLPVPDTTTVSGRRLYFSHVDGDGWNDDVDIDRYRQPPATAAEVMAKELLEPYPELPVTVGLILSDLDSAFGDAQRATDAARHIFSLPQVEVASHTATAPVTWSFFEKYSRAEEQRLMGDTSAPRKSRGWLDTVAGAFGVFEVPSEIEFNRRVYLSGTRPLPRSYLRDPFSLETEIMGAAAATSELAPQDKPVAIYSWTGDARPFEAALRETRLAGLRNINGGGARFDPDYPSVGYVTPIARQAGAERQIYAVDAPDSAFTNDAKDNPAGYSALKATLAATESPIRLKGVDLYYHAFAAKKVASLKAVRGLLEWARAAELAPVSASQYAAIADGFFSMRIERMEPGRWLISTRDGLNTVRFDDLQGQSIDMANSVGVVGSRSYQGSLYVALDPAVSDAIVALRNEAGSPDAPADLTGAQLDQANWVLRNVERESCRVSYSAAGFGAPRISWHEVPQGTYRIEARQADKVVWQTDVTVSGERSLKLAPAGLSGGPLDFSMTCAKPSPEKSS